MSVKVAKNRFINFSSVAKYHHFLGNASSIVELGKHLTLAAETAQLMRETDTVREYGLILSNLPVKEYQLIGQYYLSWYACCSGVNVPASLFENIFDRSKTYKAKSLITLGALAGAKGDLETEMQYQKEALKHADLATSIRIFKAIAIVKGKEGFHKSAIRTLEPVLPVLRFAQPQVYYDTLNSYAVELGEVGRVEEASNISKIVLASPYAFAYPEWRETSNETERKGYRRSRSVVSVIKPEPENIFKMPIAESSPTSVQGETAKLFSIREWKEKMVKEPNGETPIENVDEMDDKDLLATLIQLAAKEGVDEEKLRDVVKYAIKTLCTPRKR